jgi:hypothetical protein
MDNGKAGKSFEFDFDRFRSGGVEGRFGVLGDPIGIGTGDRLDVGGVAKDGKAGAGENMGEEGRGGRGCCEFRRGLLYLFLGIAGCSSAFSTAEHELDTYPHLRFPWLHTSWRPTRSKRWRR